MVALPLADASLDAVVSVYVIHHHRLAGIHRTVEEVGRVLKPGGLALLDVSSTVSWRYAHEEATEVEPRAFVPAQETRPAWPTATSTRRSPPTLLLPQIVDFYLNEYHLVQPRRRRPSPWAVDGHPDALSARQSASALITMQSNVFRRLMEQSGNCMGKHGASYPHGIVSVFHLAGMKTRSRNIIHIDLDAFFASVEELEEPALLGLPIVVGGDPDKRGVVSSCSYVAARVRRALRHAHGHGPPPVPTGHTHPRPLPSLLRLLAARHERALGICPRRRTNLHRRGLPRRDRLRTPLRQSGNHRPSASRSACATRSDCPARWE